jgi:hypothetical protein
MKFLSVILIIVCVGVSVACLHFVNQVNHIEAMDDYNLVRMQEGQVIEVMQTGRFWNGFPSLPATNWHSLFDVQAALVVVALLVCILPVIQHQKKIPYNAIGFFCLLFAVVPFFVGQWFLVGNTEPAASGRFLSFMVLGVLYSTAAGLLFLTLNLLQRNKAAVVEETP